MNSELDKLVDSLGDQVSAGDLARIAKLARQDGAVWHQVSAALNLRQLQIRATYDADSIASRVSLPRPESILPKLTWAAGWIVAACLCIVLDGIASKPGVDGQQVDAQQAPLHADEALVQYLIAAKSEGRLVDVLPLAPVWFSAQDDGDEVLLVRRIVERHTLPPDTIPRNELGEPAIVLTSDRQTRGQRSF